jgi:hypothetical protein
MSGLSRLWVRTLVVHFLGNIGMASGVKMGHECLFEY